MKQQTLTEVSADKKLQMLFGCCAISSRNCREIEMVENRDL
jgi:hypothetical protein